MWKFIKKHIILTVLGSIGGCLVGVLITLLPLIIIFVMLATFNPILMFKTKEVVKQVINQEITIASFSVALPDTIAQDLTALADGRYPCPNATPMTPDIYECDSSCNCQKVDYAKQRGKTTKENTLRYDGWTIDADALGIEYIDCDFGKFVERKAGNNDKLFDWKVSDIKEGRQTMTLYNYPLTGTKNKVTNKVKDASGNSMNLEWNDENPDLSLGNWGSMSTVDGRIPTCLGAMAVVPQSGVRKNIEARNYFHIGTHWYMTRGWSGHFTAEETGVGEKWLNLWTNAIPIGSYVDVVFQNNTTGQEVVVPFVYFEAKDLRQGVDMTYPQFTDIRYGHVCEEIVKPANDWIERDQECLMYEYKIEGASGNEENVQTASNKSIWACTEEGKADNVNMGNGLYGITKNVGQTTWFVYNETIEVFDVPSQKFMGEPQKEFYALLSNGQMAKLTLTGKTTKQHFISYYYSENDERKYKNSSFLETLLVWQNTSAQKPSGNWSDAMFNKILDKSDGSSITISNWHIKATRLYNKRIQDGWFKDIRDKMPSGTISSSNKVVKFCESNCKCSICMQGEARPNR